MDKKQKSFSKLNLWKKLKTCYGGQLARVYYITIVRIGPMGQSEDIN